MVRTLLSKTLSARQPEDRTRTSPERHLSSPTSASCFQPVSAHRWSLGFSTCRLTHRLGLPHPQREDPILGGRVEVRDSSAPFCLSEPCKRIDLGTREEVPGVHIGSGYVDDGHLVRHMSGLVRPCFVAFGYNEGPALGTLRMLCKHSVSPWKA